jgi:hypothetical protein
VRVQYLEGVTGRPSSGDLETEKSSVETRLAEALYFTGWESELRSNSLPSRRHLN